MPVFTMTNLFRLLLFTALLAILTGCASPAKTAKMVPTQFMVERKHPQTTSVSVTGGRKTNPLWKSDIAGEDFAQSLTEAIERSGLFSSVFPAGKGDYKLDVALVKVMTPNVGFDMTVTMVTEWRLTQISSGKLIAEEFITTPFTATVGDAFVAITRIRIANEGAARENIKEGIRRLSALNL